MVERFQTSRYFFVVIFFLCVHCTYSDDVNLNGIPVQRAKRPIPPPPCKYDFFSDNHVMCKDDVGREIPMDESLKNELVDFHNRVRNEVEQTPANMMKMSWNEELAKIAIKQARLCDSGEYDPIDQQAFREKAYCREPESSGDEECYTCKIKDSTYENLCDIDGKVCFNGGYMNLTSGLCQCTTNGDEIMFTGEHCEILTCHDIGSSSEDCDSDTCEDHGFTVSAQRCPYYCKICPDTCDLDCQNGGFHHYVTDVDETRCTCVCPKPWHGSECEICDVPCVHGVHNSNCSGCDCIGNWEGELCNVCPITECKAGTYDSEKCLCECEKNAFGLECEYTCKETSVVFANNGLAETCGEYAIGCRCMDTCDLCKPEWHDCHDNHGYWCWRMQHEAKLSGLKQFCDLYEQLCPEQCATPLCLDL